MSGGDPIFDTDFARRTLVEASAGTGKTFALAGLFARAVIVRRLRVPEVLAVTFTDKATEELTTRVRDWLTRAAALAATPEAAGDGALDAVLGALIAQALAGESREALCLRLARARRELDVAAIHTIHGFCQRLLREHALQVGQPVAAAELEPDNAERRRALAVALWRDAAADAEASAFLRRAFGGVDALADALRALLSPDALRPVPPPVMPADPRPAVDAAWRAMVAAHRAHGADLRARLTPLLGNGLNRGQYKTEHLDAVFDWLARQPEAPSAETLHEKLEKYGTRALARGCNKGVAAPASPLCDAIDALLDARVALDAWRAADDARRLHALRERARALDAARKRARNVRGYDDLIDAVHAAIADAATRPPLVAAVRAQFRLALVDEFQDTDARQWAIFDALFADGALVLVGDPKQAIYRFRGGDVATYVRARGAVDDTATLARNFRSRPAVIEAVNAMFAAMAPPHAMGAGIAFEAAWPGGGVRDDDLQLDGAPAPALACDVVPPDPAGPRRADDARDVAARLCAAAIVERLQAGRDGALRLRDGDTLRSVEPRDCAVLVRNHREGARVRRLLAASGVPVASAGRHSLYASDDAADLLTLLVALQSPGDERRLRAALATPLFGFDAADLHALDGDGAALRDWQQRFEDGRARWERFGPQAMLADVLATRAEALRARVDGERRLANALHLAELLQGMRLQRLGLQGQVDALRAAMDAADPDDPAQQPRLESDAACVQILTLHAAKGLEFPLVFLPFAGIGQKSQSVKGAFAQYADGDVRVRHWKGDAAGWGAACSAQAREEDEEAMRLLYVGLTRARHALWLCAGALAYADTSTLGRLLGGDAPAQALRDALGPRLVVRDARPPTAPPLLPPRASPPPPPAREARRVLRRDWWIHSFSQLHRQLPHGVLAGGEEAPARDERALADVAAEAEAVVVAPTPFAGERFGNALHHALERVDFAAWRGHDAAPSPAQRDLLREALASQHYPRAQWDDGVAALGDLVARTLNAPMALHGGGARALCDVPARERVAEMEFHFTLADAPAAALLARLHAGGLVRHREDFGGWSRLAGLMTGKIDLVARVDGRLYVIDYKSNRLPAYDASALDAAMRASEYDLQALLYTVAVHRWLRARRGSGYDYDRDVGGVRYLFARGLDPAVVGAGVHATRFERALVEDVDALLAGGAR